MHELQECAYKGDGQGYGGECGVEDVSEPDGSVFEFEPQAEPGDDHRAVQECGVDGIEFCVVSAAEPHTAQYDHNERYPVRDIILLGQPTADQKSHAQYHTENSAGLGQGQAAGQAQDEGRGTCDHGQEHE